MHPPIDKSITFTYTDDLDRASGFFADVMELVPVLDQGPCRIFRLTENSYLGICHLPDRPSGPAGVTISLVTPDVDAWHGFLTDKGLEYVNPPAENQRFGIYTSLFLSPDGYRIEIQSFPEESPIR